MEEGKLFRRIAKKAKGDKRWSWIVMKLSVLLCSIFMNEQRSYFLIILEGKKILKG